MLGSWNIGAMFRSLPAKGSVAWSYAMELRLFACHEDQTSTQLVPLSLYRLLPKMTKTKGPGLIDTLSKPLVLYKETP